MRLAALAIDWPTAALAPVTGTSSATRCCDAATGTTALGASANTGGGAATTGAALGRGVEQAATAIIASDSSNVVTMRDCPPARACSMMLT